MTTYKAGMIKAKLNPKVKDLGDGFKVRRALPFATHRSVGPWVFFDHFGPVEFHPGSGMDVSGHIRILVSQQSPIFLRVKSFIATALETLFPFVRVRLI